MASNKKFTDTDFYKKNKDEIDRELRKASDELLEDLQKLGINEFSPGDISEDFFKNGKETHLCTGYPNAMTGIKDGN